MLFNNYKSRTALIKKFNVLLYTLNKTKNFFLIQLFYWPSKNGHIVSQLFRQRGCINSYKKFLSQEMFVPTKNRFLQL